MQTINPSLQPQNHRPGAEGSDSRNNPVALLLQGISLHSFCHEESEFEDFQRSLHNLQEEVNQADDNATLLLAETAIRRLEEHNKAAGLAISVRQEGLKDAIALISDSLLAVCLVDETLEVELRESHRAIASASTTTDVAVGRERLDRCLADIRDEVQHRNEDALLSSQAYGENEIDPVTSLPNSRKAVEAITAAWNHRYEYNAAVFAVRRLDTINMRFGFQAGDEVLRAMSEHLAGLFVGQKLLFRWRGPYLFALINREAEESRVARLASTRLQHTMVLKTREVLLSISIDWKQFPLEAGSIEDMIRTLDEVTTIQLQKEQ